MTTTPTPLTPEHSLAAPFALERRFMMQTDGCRSDSVIVDNFHRAWLRESEDLPRTSRVDEVELAAIRTLASEVHAAPGTAQRADARSIARRRSAEPVKGDMVLLQDRAEQDGHKAIHLVQTPPKYVGGRAA